MKRYVAVLALVGAVWVLGKLGVKPVDMSARAPHSLSAVPAGDHTSERNASAGAVPTDIVAKYRLESPDVRALVARVAERYGRNALAIDRTDGLRGLTLLDRMDLEAIFLYEKHPDEFRRLAGLMGVDAAADLLWHWRSYFGLKRADEADRAALIGDIAGLGPGPLRVAARYPSALPLVLTDPQGVTELVEQMAGDEKAIGDILAMLSCIDLEPGPSSLRAALRTIDLHGTLALEAFRRHGPAGFALVGLYGPVLEALGDLAQLDDNLVLLHVNAGFVDELLRTHRPETVAGHLRHGAAAGLTGALGGSPQALRLMVEYGAVGERALKQAGSDAAEVVYADFHGSVLRGKAVAALAEYGVVALAMLEKYATDPDFQTVLRAHGAAVIPPIAQADAAPETLAYLQSKSHRSFTEGLASAVLFAAGDNGLAVIRTIKNDGLERVAQLSRTDIRFYQFLPLYDLLHLGNVMRQGYAPSTGEMTWALVDGSFVVADVLSLAAVQPEGAVASEAVRAEVKVAAREAARSAGRELAAAGSVSAGKSLARREAVGAGERAAADLGSSLISRRLARWWTVRSAGGLYEVLRRMPEALPRLGLKEISDTAGPLCARAGMRLSAWKPVRLLRDGADVVLRIPPERGLKYVAVQAVQAGVGVVACQKMEEHLAARRPRRL